MICPTEYLVVTPTMFHKETIFVLQMQSNLCMQGVVTSNINIGLQTYKYTRPSTRLSALFTTICL